MNRIQGIALSILASLVSLYFFGLTLAYGISSGYEKSLWMMVISGLFLFLFILFAFLALLLKKNRDAMLDKRPKKTTVWLSICTLVALALSMGVSFSAGSCLGKKDLSELKSLFSFNLNKKEPAAEEPEQNKDFQGELADQPAEAPKPEDSQNLELYKNASGQTVINDIQTLSEQFLCEDPDKSVMIVGQSGQLSLSGSILDKRGNAEDPQKALKTGINSAVLVTEDGSLNILSSRITTDAAGAAAVTLANALATGNIQDSILTTQQNDSFVLGALNGSSLTTSRNRITSQADESPLVSLDLKSSFVSDGDAYTSNGKESPWLKGQGIVKATGVSVNCAGGSAMEIDGGSQVDIQGAVISALGKDYDGVGGIIRLQSSGEDETVLNISSSSIAYLPDSAYASYSPVFSVNGGSARVYLYGNNIQATSGLLCFAQGAKTDFVLDQQTLSGTINGDSESDLILEIENGSYFTGSVNSFQSAKSAKVHLAANARWVLTQDVYLTAFEADDPAYSNIEFGPYHIYLNGTSIN